MIQLQPKQHFQGHEAPKRELAQVCQSDNFQFALTFALSEYVLECAPSAEQLAGVRQFIAVLLNLPLKDEPLPIFPTRTLSHNQNLTREGK